MMFPIQFPTAAQSVAEAVIIVGRWGTGTVRRFPSGRYQARITIDGRKVPLGTFATRPEATAAIARATRELRGGVVVGRTVGGVRLDEWVEQWWATRVGHRQTTRERDRGILDNEVLPHLGRRRLVEITPADVQLWVSELASRVAPATVYRCYTIFAQLLGAAVDAGLLTASPAVRVRLPRRNRYEARFLTPEELELLADVIGERWRAMVLTIAYATLRIGEAVCGASTCTSSAERCGSPTTLSTSAAGSLKDPPRRGPVGAP